MAAKFDQIIETHGIYRKVWGHLTESDSAMLLASQDLLVFPRYKYILVDLLAVESCDENWPFVFAAIIRSSKAYLKPFEGLYVVQDLSVRAQLDRFLAELEDSEWPQPIVFTTLTEARAYIAECILIDE